ncbi:alpha-N-arabinofuranosidase [Pedobacter metabolipauper]|uniref:non-reducing end alpha-L-arabinofuranosidase n=1 Tax=Pedobacter metabolipauper TaxID=425513 RepID=A0A4R6SXK6_9SPHI|nr:alpha-L-arabinofuranosidase C-terminal domain-containing protein [Pedobacter metabolipauper]TDQ08912.1 alpha-N-arabinofuranosidase [Pedobacter metabolipauper]
MKKILPFILLFFALSSKLTAQTKIQFINTNGDPPATISKYIYSHFAEHLGSGIYGGFYVGDTSRISNTNGVRNDIIAALKIMKIPSLRWPGGCFADTYHWKDGIGEKTGRPAIVNRWWGGSLEDNSFGTHDFLNLCELLDADPYMAGNIGSGTVQELADWVQYVSTDTKNPMSDLRRKNGREKPWKVRFWGVGNEAWGCGGNMTPEYYVNEYRKYATFMTDWTNSDKLFRVASGANVDDYHWTETLMKGIPKNMVEGVALHHYSFVEWSKKGSATNFTEQQYFKTMKTAWRMEELVTKHSAIMDKYDPGKKIALVVDEWGGWYDVEKGTNPGFLYQQNTIRDAMIAGVTLNIFNNHSDRVRMANLAQCINVLQAVILTNKEKMILTPTYHVMEMYNVHQDALRIPVSIQSEEYTLGTEKLPAVSASVSKDKTGVVHISLTNISAKNAQPVTIDLGDGKYRSVTGRILSSAKLQDHNSFTEPDKIKPNVFKGAALKNNQLNLSLPATSIVVLTLN